MKVDIWFPFFVNDYIADTMDLSAEEHGIYLLLLIHYWKKRGNLTKDINKLKSITKITDNELPLLQGILSEYFIDLKNSYSSKRLDEELRKAESRRAAASENGKKGGRPKKENLTETQEKPNPLTEEKPKGNSSQTSSSSPKETYEPKEKKHRHGEYKHVLMTDTQLKKLEDDYGPVRVKEMIINLDEGIEIHGYAYKNHNLTIRKWNPLSMEKPQVKKTVTAAKTENQKAIEKLQSYIDSELFTEEENENFKKRIAKLEGYIEFS